ncbi:DUF6390 family protein [Rhodococcus olei]|uniref:DUF6390 family protein n=1 Tax=Rhodococcus olei TaxID=2161675 RepID=A0ABP8PKK9_9NOCA
MPAPTAGQRLFARYAYAPNALGFCGPAGVAALADAASGGGDAAAVTAAAHRFTGAWPYQELLAELSGIADPLDARVVRAYWTGSALTDGIDVGEFGRRLLDAFGERAGHYWAHLTPALLGEVAPTHAFHVFGVYPWSRLLGTGQPQPLQVLDSCRIRWATVVDVDDDSARVCTRRLEFDGTGLALGAEQEAPVRRRTEAGTFVPDLRIGERVAVHWGFLCDRLTGDEADRLEAGTVRQLARTNARLRAELATAATK